MKLKEFLKPFSQVRDKDNCDVLFWYNGELVELESMGQFGFANDVCIRFKDITTKENKVDLYEVSQISKLISKIKRRKKIPIVGDYVIASRWSDMDPKDPWFVYFVEEIKNSQFKVGGEFFRHARKISYEEGEMINNIYQDLEFTC